jgi:hypothetical protein
LSAKTAEVHLLLGSTKTREQFRSTEPLGQRSTVCRSALKTQHSPLPLLFHIELLGLHLELLLCATGCVSLLLSREAHTSGFLTSLFTGLLSLHSELSLLLTSRLLGLESTQT